MSDKESFFLAIILGIIVSIGYVSFEYYACKQKSISFDDYKYNPISGCMVSIKGKWLPLDNIRGFDGK